MSHMGCAASLIYSYLPTTVLIVGRRDQDRPIFRVLTVLTGVFNAKRAAPKNAKDLIDCAVDLAESDQVKEMFMEIDKAQGSEREEKGRR
jgi:hypothetical protein